MTNSIAPSFYVYVHSRLKNGEPFYVGKGNGRRYAVDRRNKYWRNIVNKDGGFYTSFVSRNIDEDLAFLVETELIAKYRRAGARLTNCTNGGDGVSGMRHTKEAKSRIGAASVGNKYSLGNRLSEVTRAKIGAASKGNKHALGYRHTPEALAKIAAIASLSSKGHKRCLGRRHSEETKAKLSAARMGNKHSSSPEARAKISAANTGNQYCLGFKHSAEARANMSAAHIGRSTGPMSQERRANIASALRASWKRRKAAT